MPVIEVKMLSGRSAEQRKEIVRQITDVMVNVAGARKEAVSVILHESSPEHYAVGGELFAEKIK
ncbi:MAG: 2-hydroxymuconate tautomerase [Carboxydocellales bacterium]